MSSAYLFLLCLFYLLLLLCLINLISLLSFYYRYQVYYQYHNFHYLLLFEIICSFPKDMSENFNKLLNLQILLKKEHRSCVEMFESYALVSFTFGCFSPFGYLCPILVLIVQVPGHDLLFTSISHCLSASRKHLLKMGEIWGRNQNDKNG